MITTTPPKIIVHPSGDTATSLYRIIGPAAALRQAGHATTIGRMRFLTADELKVANPTSIVLQGQYTDAQLRDIKMYRKTLPKCHITYDLDDAGWLVLDSNAASRELPKDVKRRIKTAISHVDTVTVTTDYLAKTVRDAFRAKDVRVIPNHLPARFINEAEAGRRAVSQSASPAHKPRIGWSGSLSHADDVAFLKEVIPFFGNRVQWVFHGLLPAWLDSANPNIEYHDFVPLAEYPRKLGGLNLDLALAPLADNAFNLNKSPLKLLEYGACGYAVLADKTGPYIGFPHVWHAADHTPHAWIQAIEALLLSPTGLEAIGERLNTHVKDNYRLEDHLLAWQVAWMPKSAIPFVPSTGSTNRLILRDGTHAPRDLQERLEKHLGGAASVSAIHSDGLYPIAGTSVQIPQELATQIDEAADFAGCDPVTAPYPTGPAILLSGTALDRIGEPDITRYGNVDAAMLDWGARAMEAGLAHAVSTDTYAASTVRASFDAAESQRIVNDVGFWCPFFIDAAKAYGEVDPLSTARRNIEMSFIRREYTSGNADITDRILLINPSEDEVKEAVTNSLVFCAKLDGHFLHFTFPQMPNVAAIDTREPIDAFIEVLGRLALPHIAFKGLGDGTLGAVGFLADVADAGWRVDAVMLEYSDKHRVSQDQWQAAWDNLLKHQVSEDAMANDNG